MVYADVELWLRCTAQSESLESIDGMSASI